jgi:hypothetical protein
MAIEQARRSGVMTMALLFGAVRATLAATPCALPEAYPIALEQRAAVLGTGPGVVAPAQPSPASPLLGGDAVRQINGDRVDSCADVERVVAAAFAKGLPLLLAVERAGGVVPLLVQTRAAAAENPAPVPAADIAPTPPAGGATAVAPRAVANGVPGVAVSAGEVPASARAVVAGTTGDGAGAEAGDVASSPVVTKKEEVPVRRARVSLPARAGMHAAVIEAAREALARLRDVERGATMTVPLVVYEQRRANAAAAIGDIEFGPGEDAAAVRDVVASILDIHRTASEILHAKVRYQIDSRHELRVRTLPDMPYFSDGEVPRWVAAYPFLDQAIVAPPKATRILIAGESSGRWSPDRAAELLWEHAREETERLAAWLAAE